MKVYIVVDNSSFHGCVQEVFSLKSLAEDYVGNDPKLDIEEHNVITTENE